MESKPLNEALQNISQELSDFTALFTLDPKKQQKQVADSILFALEANLFAQDPLGNIVCRNDGELFRQIWENVCTWPPIQAEAKIYQLSPATRAALYLFVRKGMSEVNISTLLALDEGELALLLEQGFMTLTGESDLALEAF